jgi:hypothetical protein
MRRRFGGRHGNKWLAGVWVAVILQLHIFFVLQLHHHQGFIDTVSKLPLSATKGPQPPAIQAVNLLCPACQIARHGIVQPAGEAVLAARLLKTERVPDLFAAKHYLVPFLKLSGRDPPQC